MSVSRWLIFLIFSLFISCNSDQIYSNKITLDSPYWLYKDSLKYEFTITDTAQNYTMELDVNHIDTFGFENCYVQIHSVYPDGTSKNDVLSLEFADASGQWLGKNSGSKWLVPIALQPVARFKQTGKYTMAFYQHNRVDSLAGIESMKLMISKLK
ncbi:MAG TPA: gliding motility lipoprotein GldH [Saprospiraceae bacterium]|nr:gliding motility lipoprotein GldH [Saprospiraceae bacterium]